MNEGFAKLFSQMLQSGQEMARAFNPALEGFDPKAFEKMLPVMPADMMEMWFGRTFNREGLDAKTRLLLTIGALTVQGALLAQSAPPAVVGAFCDSRLASRHDVFGTLGAGADLDALVARAQLA